ncbi:hypothetical protein OPV22_025251 [Ensete ventricosum]|uniref:Uncharacterized protein n=1 Tax=Ensete ventricosum TaxID=4639 RepID=A0AAV8QC58_ENSVE|nr:hypothetical protein OPV22_025251 [Ensete ventricosum]
MPSVASPRHHTDAPPHFYLIPPLRSRCSRLTLQRQSARGVPWIGMETTATTASKMGFKEEEMAVDEGLGYPKAYAKFCRSPSVLSAYAQGPPFVFLPYTLQPQEALRARDWSQMFPVTDPEAIPSINPRGFVNLLWKQLDHLGNAGFDPALFRVDPYGNVLYLHADSASPLAWDIDHWFPCSRGGRTVPSNLRLLQWQVWKKKHNKLEFLIPWWDLQLGISVTQFLSIFASRNSDFRSRAFSFLFCDGGSEELNALQAVDSHHFPQHFIEMERQVGLGPAAIVSSRRSFDASVLRPIDANRHLRHNYPLIAARKFIREEDGAHSMATQSSKPLIPKENTNPDMDTCDGNPYLSIAMARDSLRQREEAMKKQAEISRLEDELNELKQKNEEDRVALQELETLLVKRRRRVEKCRRLAEAQSSYKALLEKMIRDAMHQSVVYKEQVRLNQAATSSLMARLEAQRALCDYSEKELRRKFKQRDEIEKQIRPVWELRKRSRMDETLLEEGRNESNRLLCTRTTRTTPLTKELRKFLEEEQKASEAGLLSHGEDGEGETEESATTGSPQKEKPAVPQSQKNEEAEEHRSVIDEKLKQLAISDGHLSQTSESKQQSFLHLGSQEEAEEGYKASGAGNDIMLLNGKPRDVAAEEKVKPPILKIKIPKPRSPRKEEEDGDDGYSNQLGKRNVDKWLEILLDGFEEGSPQKKPDAPEDDNLDESVCKMNSAHPHKQINFLRLKPSEEKAGTVRNPITEQTNSSKSRHSTGVTGGSSRDDGSKEVVTGSRKSFEVKDPRSESSRGFRSLPSSPSMILGMRRGVDCIGRKPQVMGDDDNGNESVVSTNSKFIKSCSRAIKRAMNI